MRICHPAIWRGSGLITTPYPGLTPWARESVALSGSEFLGLSARQIPICYPSSTYNTSIFNCRVDNQPATLCGKPDNETTKALTKSNIDTPPTEMDDTALEIDAYARMA